MIRDKSRVDSVARDHRKIEGFEQAFSGGAQGEVGFDVDHVPLHVAAFDHGLELSVVGRPVLDHGDAAGLAERFGPGLLLRILGTAAPADEIQTLGCYGHVTDGGQETCKQDCGCTCIQRHFYALICCVFERALQCPPIGSIRSIWPLKVAGPRGFIVVMQARHRGRGARPMGCHIMVFQAFYKSFA